MNKYFITKVSYVKTMDNGLQKKVTEPYLVEAMSYTEAEARIIEEMMPYILGDFNVSDIKRSHYAEIFTNNIDNLFYKVNLAFITLDEKTGNEKRQKSKMLVMADNLPDALSNLQKAMKGTLADYVITGIEETPIIDLFPFDNQSEDNGNE